MPEKSFKDFTNAIRGGAALTQFHTESYFSPKWQEKSSWAEVGACAVGCAILFGRSMEEVEQIKHRQGHWGGVEAILQSFGVRHLAVETTDSFMNQHSRNIEPYLQDLAGYITKLNDCWLPMAQAMGLIPAGDIRLWIADLLDQMYAEGLIHERQ